MQASQRPRRLAKPFASSAGSGFVRQVPVPAQPNGAASYEQGFPPETFQPVASGGVPPSGADMNGVLQDVSANAMAYAAGLPAQYDSFYANAISGYPMYAVLAGSAVGTLWQSTTDNNTTNPDGGDAANWRRLGGVAQSNLQPQNGYRVQDDGFKTCWGSVSVPARSSVTVSMPVQHDSWCLAVGSSVIPGQDEQNCGVESCGTSSFVVRNYNPRATTFFWHSTGV